MFDVNVLLFSRFPYVYNEIFWLCQSGPPAFTSSQKYWIRVFPFEDFHSISQNAVTRDESSQPSEMFREFCGARACGSEEVAAHTLYKYVDT